MCVPLFWGSLRMPSSGVPTSGHLGTHYLHVCGVGGVMQIAEFKKNRNGKRNSEGKIRGNTRKIIRNHYGGNFVVRRGRGSTSSHAKKGKRTLFWPKVSIHWGVAGNS